MSSTAVLLVPDTKNKKIQNIRVNFDGYPEHMLKALNNANVKDIVKAKEIRGIDNDGKVEGYSGGKILGSYSTKEDAFDNAREKFTYYYSTTKKKWHEVKRIKDIKESENEMQDLKDMLATRAIEKVEEMREGSKPDFNDLGIDEARIVKRAHAKGGITKHKKASNEGQKSKLTGKSKQVRKAAGRKLKKTLRKVGAGKKARAVKKRARAMKKKGVTFKKRS